MQIFVTMVIFLKDVFRPCLLNTYHFYDLNRYRKHQGSVYFLLEVFSLKNEGVIAVILKITFMTSRDRKCVGGAR